MTRGSDTLPVKAAVLGVCMLAVGQVSADIAIGSALPAEALISNPPGANGNSTVGSGTTPVKGNSFVLTSSASITAVTFRVASVSDVIGDIALDFYRLSGTPDSTAGNGQVPTGVSLSNQVESLPAAPTLAAADYLTIGLHSPLDLLAGNYAFAISTTNTDFNLRLNNDNAYTEGELVRQRASNDAWEDRNNDMVFALQGELTGTNGVRPAASAGPNIVFVLVDDWGWTDHDVPALALGHESDFFQTPNFSRLTKESVLFTSAYAQPNCAPTRAALLSGQYSPRHGNGVYNVQSLNRQGGKTTYTTPADQGTEHASGDEQAVTIAEALYNAGYVTAHFGKYHAGASNPSDPTFPLNQGFDYNFGGDNNGAPGNYIASGQKFGSKVGPELDAFAADYTIDYITNNLLPYANGNDPMVLTNAPAKHLTDAMADAFISFMNGHASGSTSNYPVYVQLHFYAVHGPITGRRDLKAKYDALPPGSKHSQKGYAALIEGMDHSLGRVIDYLDDPNGDGNPVDSIATNTLVIFCSDNGGTHASNAPLRGEKGMHYEGGIRVPALVRMPGTIPTNSVTDTLVHVVDFYPTMLDFAGAAYPNTVTHPLDGVSLHAHLLDPNGSPRNRGPIFYHFPGYMDNRAYASSAMIKEIDGKRYKYIYAYDPYYNPGSGVADGFDQYQLYNLSDDISETVNLLDFIDEENDADPDDPSTAEEYWNYLLYQDLGNHMASNLNRWLVGTPGDTTWNPIYVTYKSNFPGIAPALIGQESGPPAASLPEVVPPRAQSFHILDAVPNAPALQTTLPFVSATGFSYFIEGSFDLKHWTMLESNIVGESGLTTHVVSDRVRSNATTRFYRVGVSD